MRTQVHERRWSYDQRSDMIETSDGYSLCWSKEQQVWVVCFRCQCIGKYSDLLTALRHTDAFLD